MTRQKGFTLIETIIYIGLFGVIIGGGLVAAYQIIQATDGAQNHVILQEEANFLLRKIDWAITGATETTDVGRLFSSLGIAKPISGILTQLTFALDDSNLTLKRDSAPAVVLNSSSIAVSGLNFIKIAGLGGKPDSISVSFTLTTVQHGRSASQLFSFVKYLRQ